MSGALIELVSKGIQDVYITDTAGVSFFKIKYQRHTNFAQVPKKLGFTGQLPAANSTSVIKLERLGDLINHMWLEGASIVDRLPGTVFDLYIGGQRVDSQTFDYMNDIWQVYMAETYAKSRNINISTNSFFPLHFFFCDNDMFLPIVALQYTEAEIRITWGSGVPQGAVVDCCANYVYLDTTEREEIVSKDMDLMITQIQRYACPLSTGRNVLDLGVLNHPVKSIYFGFEKKELYVPDDSFTFSGADLQLNGTPAFEDMTPLYFHTVQCYYKTKFGNSGFNVQAGAPVHTRYFAHNFCMDASSYKPTGTCNFSRLDNAKLVLKNVTISSARVSDDIKVYAVNYNILRIKKGIAGIIFAN
jgi:hypothetical protein